MFELLENRRLYSVSLANGVLQVTGTGAADQISISLNTAKTQVRVSQNGASTQSFAKTDVQKITVSALSGNDVVKISKDVTAPATLNGGTGDDRLHAGGGATTENGGGGNDQLFGGSANDALNGQAGDDTIVSIGGGHSDHLSGGTGVDTFWRDAESTETISDRSSTEVSLQSDHRVAKFADARIDHGLFNGVTTTSISRELNGQNLPDPLVFSDPDTHETPTYANFANDPLFASAGPKVTDIHQGRDGDCYFLAAIGSIATQDPAFIKRHVVDLGDGTYAVRFKRGSTETYVRVDGDLPVFSDGFPAYEDLGNDDSLWPAIVEKAYAYFRKNAGTYDSIQAGSAGNALFGLLPGAFTDMGVSNTTISPLPFMQDTILQQLRTAVNSGKAVTAGTPLLAGLDGTPVFGSHEYVVNNFFVNAAGKITSVKLYNPHGVDFGGNNAGDLQPFDGFLTISADRFYANFSEFDIATV